MSVARKPTVGEARPGGAGAIGQPTVIAASARPATTAPVPSNRCENSGTYDERPRVSTPTTSEPALATLSTRIRNTHSGRTGSLARRSTSTNAVRTTAAAANSPTLV